jgi:hypothetical protein
MEKLAVGLRREIAAHFDTAYQCGVCGAIYSFRAQVSLAFAANAAKKPNNSDAPNELEQL